MDFCVFNWQMLYNELYILCKIICVSIWKQIEIEGHTKKKHFFFLSKTKRIDMQFKPQRVVSLVVLCIDSGYLKKIVNASESQQFAGRYFEKYRIVVKPSFSYLKWVQSMYLHKALNTLTTKNKHICTQKIVICMSRSSDRNIK